MFNKISKLLTSNYRKIPLFIVYFNYKKYRKDGKKNSCLFKHHPIFKDDKYIKETLNNLVDYIRDKYNIEDII